MEYALRMRGVLMRQLVPVLFCLAALALPPAAHAAGKPDMSCVKGDCKKTDPAIEAAKEMNKAAGLPANTNIDAPVESARPALDSRAMMPPDAAIREVQDAVNRESRQRSLAGSSASAYNFSGQSESCSPYKADQEAMRQKFANLAQQREPEQRVIGEKITAQQRMHIEDQLRIRQILNDSVAAHNVQQRQQEAQSAAYQQKVAAEGVVINEKIAANVRAHQETQLKLRCLTRDTFDNMGRNLLP